MARTGFVSSYKREKASGQSTPETEESGGIVKFGVCWGAQFTVELRSEAGRQAQNLLHSL